MSEFWGEFRFGLRLLARSPVFAITALLLLGIGIGANTLIFSVVDTLLLRPLPVKHPEQLVRLIEAQPTNFITWELPYPMCEQLAHASSLSEAFCEGILDVAFEHGGAIERIRVNAVSQNFFSALGIHARLGRVLTPEDDKSGRLCAVLSYEFWQSRLAGSPSAVGQTIRLDGRAFTVVGVLPEDVNGLTVDTSPAVRIPLTAGQRLARWRAPNADPAFLLPFQVFGRLRPGIPLGQAEAEVEPLLRQTYEDALLRAFPKSAQRPRKEVFDSRLDLEPIGNGISSLRGQFSQGLILLMAGVGLLLLMACANVACLLLARSAERSQEIGIRLALGATRWRVARQFLTESLALALPGGALGVLFTYLCRPLLVAALPPIRDRAAILQPLDVHIEIDLRVLAFAVAISLLTALLFGLSPAIRSGRYNAGAALRGSRTTTARLSGRNILVAAQVAICLLLLTGASLLVQTFDRMRAMNPGFDRDHIATFTVDPGLKGYKPDQARRLSRELLNKTRSLPGVTAAGIASRGIMRGTGIKTSLGAAGTPIQRNDFLNSSLNSVTRGFFDAMGMHIVAGRDFTWSDHDEQKPQPVIVNEAFVQRFFRDQSPLGRLFGGRGSNGLASADDQIIGVVNDAKYRSLREKIPPTVYGPVVNGFDSDFVLYLRTHGNPAALIAPVREVLRSLDPELPFVEVTTLREEVETSLWQERLLAWLSTIFSCFAALLAGIGLYGSLDFAVRIRTREIGIRAALGADAIRLVRLLSVETLLLVGSGALVGIVLYATSAPWIRLVLYGVTPYDPTALGLALLFVAAVAVFAVAPPLWRAVRIDPASALRHE
jgi:predicted permease